MIRATTILARAGTDRAMALQLVRNLGVRDTLHLLKQVDWLGSPLEHSCG